MTDGMLKSSALNESVRKNVVVETPTADFLVNQMRAGALDAAIVYKVNWGLQEEHLDFVAINHEGAKAIQPYSIRDGSPHSQLAFRLLEHFQRNKERFETTGFTWLDESEAIDSRSIKIPKWLKTE